MIKKNLLNTLVAVSLITQVGLFAKTYAIVGNQEITDKDIKLVDPSLNFGVLAKEQQDRIINRLVDNTLLSKYAKREGITKTKEFKTKLKLLSDNLAVQMFMEKEFPKVEASQKEAKVAFEKNKKELSKNKQIRAKHILVKSEEEANTLISKLRKAKYLKATFEDLAKKYSTGPSGKRGGELGWFSKDKMVPAFSKAAFALKKGEFTQIPVKTQFGYHIILVEAMSDNFEDVKESMIREMSLKNFQDRIKSILEKLKQEIKVTIK